ncbi:MAG: hypothetical protein ACI9XC_002413 [Gammaproteobacteria bacterium]|jgi:hypothetical protein
MASQKNIKAEILTDDINIAKWNITFFDQCRKKIGDPTGFSGKEQMMLQIFYLNR